ncbi:MAG: radical SAM protein [Humidesulfovibrio sp.]|nr:radical SAM protein [Humidesulfovibrio sp.]
MTTFPGIYTHPPGALSNGAVLDIGLKCPHSCAFCYYSFLDGGPEQFSGLRKASLRSTADCLEIVREVARNGLRHLDITGGEPTVHPGLTDIVREAAGLGLGVRCISLGQFLLRKQAQGTLLEALLDAGLTDILFSLHAADPESFRTLSGGSLETVQAVMDRLDARGFQYSCNTVITEKNLRQLPDIARMAVKRGIYAANFIAFNAYHAWRGQEQAKLLQTSYSAIRPQLEEAVAILTADNAAVNIRYAPLCAFPSLARHVVGVLGVPYDPYEWRNRCLNHDQPPAHCAEPLPIPATGIREIFAFSALDETLPDGTRVCGMRGDRFKFFPAQCGECPAQGACDGVDPTYLARYGAAEFAPLDLPTQGPLLAARLEYLPPFLVKMQAQADMRGAIATLGARG